MNWPLFIVLAIACVLVVLLVHALDLAASRPPSMTSRRRRQLMRDRYDLNPALKRR